MQEKTTTTPSILSIQSKYINPLSSIIIILSTITLYLTFLISSVMQNQKFHSFLEEFVELTDIDIIYTQQYLQYFRICAFLSIAIACLSILTNNLEKSSSWQKLNKLINQHKNIISKLLTFSLIIVFAYNFSIASIIFSNMQEFQNQILQISKIIDNLKQEVIEDSTQNSLSTIKAFLKELDLIQFIMILHNAAFVCFGMPSLGLLYCYWNSNNKNFMAGVSQNQYCHRSATISEDNQCGVNRNRTSSFQNQISFSEEVIAKNEDLLAATNDVGSTKNSNAGSNNNLEDLFAVSDINST